LLTGIRQEAKLPVLTAARPIAAALDQGQVRNAMIGFFGIMDLWNASSAQARGILGTPPERTFYKWKAGIVGTVPLDAVKRIGYVSGIWKALQILYNDRAQADGWVHRSNKHFGGQTPMERMGAGDVTDLAAVRQYLDAARGPWS
jgi:hypothetical protein